MTPQLKLFASDDNLIQPLPLQIAGQYGFPLQYHTQDDDTLLYAVQDWIAGLTGEPDTTKISELWRKFKKQTRTSIPSLKLPYKARDGKTYQRDYAPDMVLYQFAAYARALKDRP